MEKQEFLEKQSDENESNAKALPGNSFINSIRNFTAIFALVASLSSTGCARTIDQCEPCSYYKQNGRKDYILRNLKLGTKKEFLQSLKNDALNRSIDSFVEEIYRELSAITGKLSALLRVEGDLNQSKENVLKELGRIHKQLSKVRKDLRKVKSDHPKYGYKFMKVESFLNELFKVSERLFKKFSGLQNNEV